MFLSARSTTQAAKTGNDIPLALCTHWLKAIRSLRLPLLLPSNVCDAHGGAKRSRERWATKAPREDPRRAAPTPMALHAPSIACGMVLGGLDWAAGLSGLHTFFSQGLFQRTVRDTISLVFCWLVLPPERPQGATDPKATHIDPRSMMDPCSTPTRHKIDPKTTPDRFHPQPDPTRPTHRAPPSAKPPLGPPPDGQLSTSAVGVGSSRVRPSTLAVRDGPGGAGRVGSLGCPCGEVRRCGTAGPKPKANKSDIAPAAHPKLSDPNTS